LKYDWVNFVDPKKKKQNYRKQKSFILIRSRID
jgi:hypothetical protein